MSPQEEQDLVRHINGARGRLTLAARVLRQSSDASDPLLIAMRRLDQMDEELRTLGRQLVALETQR